MEPKRTGLFHVAEHKSGFCAGQIRNQLAELAEYVAKLDEHDGYDLMLYVFRSGDAKTDDERVFVIGPDKLAEMVIDAGLVNWLVRKVS